MMTGGEWIAVEAIPVIAMAAGSRPKQPVSRDSAIKEWVSIALPREDLNWAQAMALLVWVWE